MLLWMVITYRTNILLDNQTKAILDYLVAKKKKTVGSIFRDLLVKEGKEHKIKTVEKERTRAEVVADIDRIRKQINTKGINYREMIDYGRKY